MNIYIIPLMDSSMRVPHPWFFFHIKSVNEIHKRKFRSLVFKRSGKIPPRGRDLGNNISDNKLSSNTHSKCSRSLATESYEPSQLRSGH